MHVIKCMSLFFAVRTVILQLPTYCHFDVIFIPPKMVSQSRHFWFPEILLTKSGFLDQFYIRKTAPPKIEPIQTYELDQITYRPGKKL